MTIGTHSHSPQFISESPPRVSAEIVPQSATRTGAIVAAIVALLYVLCIAMTLVRWAGVLQAVIIVGLLMNGWTWKRNSRIFEKRWIPPLVAAFLSLGLAGGTMYVLRGALKVSPQEQLAQQES